MKEQMNKTINDIKEKLENHNTPEVEKALKRKLKMLEGNNTVLK